MLEDRIRNEGMQGVLGKGEERVGEDGRQESKEEMTGRRAAQQREAPEMLREVKAVILSRGA